MLGELRRVSSLLSGDLSYDCRAEAREIVDGLIDSIRADVAVISRTTNIEGVLVPTFKVDK